MFFLPFIYRWINVQNIRTLATLIFVSFLYTYAHTNTLFDGVRANMFQWIWFFGWFLMRTEKCVYWELKNWYVYLTLIWKLPKNHTLFHSLNWILFIYIIIWDLHAFRKHQPIFCNLCTLDLFCKFSIRSIFSIDT